MFILLLSKLPYSDLRVSVAREVSILSSLAREQKKTRIEQFEWLRRNGQCFKVEQLSNSYEGTKASHK